MGLIYSVSVSWNINAVYHNLIHNPFFKSRILNRLFGIMESVTLGISQTFYKHVHHRHHMGNSDRPDEHGETPDWISIYRHGHNGEAENPWSYIFLSYLREDPKVIYQEIKRKNPVDARWGIIEIVVLGVTIAIGFVLNWKFWSGRTCRHVGFVGAKKNLCNCFVYPCNCVPSPLQKRWLL